MSPDEIAPVPRPETGASCARGLFLGGGLLLLFIAIFVVFVARGGRPQSDPTVSQALNDPDDPRLRYAGPLRNIHPAVRYVGDARCAECHAKETATFREHPMGRSLAPIAERAADQGYDPPHHNPFTVLDNRFLVDRQGDAVWHRRTRLDRQGRPAFTQALPVYFAVGSGRRGYSYLTVRGEPGQDAYVFETPISWFSQAQRWDLSPGFNEALLPGRPISGDCLFCHANRTRPRAGCRNRFAAPVFDGYAIGCERCHGPGELHAASAAAQDIVNPGKLAFPLRDAVCEQCHLQGVVRVDHRGRDLYDFRPGLPLEAFTTVFIRPSEERTDDRAVNHVEQMYGSRCFTASKRRLGCISCHDPHVAVDAGQRVAHYRARCLACHESQGCSLPQADRLARQPADSCIDCHMPRYRATNIAHIAVTDHRIVRRAPADLAAPAAGHPPGVALVPFAAERLDPEAPEQVRDLGVALARAAEERLVHPALASERAIGLLQASVRRWPDDAAAWDALGMAFSIQGQREQGLKACETALAKDAQREHALVQAATLAQALHRPEAVDYWRRAVAVNPWMPGYRRELALLLKERDAWDEARQHCRAWLDLDPGSVDAHALWMMCLVREGKRAEARAEFARIEALQPPNLAALREWLKKQAP